MTSISKRLTAATGGLAIVAAGAALALPSGADGKATPKKATVNLVGMSFSPTHVTIKKNGTISFKWKSGTHNVLFAKKSGARDIGVKSSGTTVRTFKKKGTFQFVCALHGGVLGKKGGMTATVTVK